MEKASGKYQPPTGVEAEAQPGSRGHVLRNKLGIISARKRDRAEYDALLRAQAIALGWVTTETRFTAAILRRLHGDWLGDVYDWAGQYRTVDVSKDGFTWPPAALVAQNMIGLEYGLLRRHTPCRPASLPKIARRLAEVHAELLLIHPFREGNGRLARWLADLMALQAGVPAPAYPFQERGGLDKKAKYIAAVKEGYLMRYDALTGFFLEALERRGSAGV